MNERQAKTSKWKQQVNDAYSVNNGKNGIKKSIVGCRRTPINNNWRFVFNVLPYHKFGCPHPGSYVFIDCLFVCLFVLTMIYLCNFLYVQICHCAFFLGGLATQKRERCSL